MNDAEGQRRPRTSTESPFRLILHEYMDEAKNPTPLHPHM